MVVLLGPDGCGKSTIANLMIDYFRKTGTPVRHQHWRPNIFPSPRRFLGKKPTSNPSRPHAKKSHSTLVSFFLALYYWTDFWIGFLFQVLPFRKKGGIFIAERYIFDMWLDPIRHRLGTSPRLISLLCRFAPKPQLIVVLTGDLHKMYERKMELKLNEIETQLNRIEEYFKNHLYVIFINTTEGPPEIVVDQILKKMSSFGLC